MKRQLNCSASFWKPTIIMIKCHHLSDKHEVKADARVESDTLVHCEKKLELFFYIYR